MSHIESAGATGTTDDAPPPESPPQSEPANIDANANSDGFAITGGSARESAGTLRFTVSVSGADSEPLTVAYATEDNTATASADYDAVSGRLTFTTASNAAQHIDVPLLDDVVEEAVESFTMRLSDPRGAPLAVAAAGGTILDDDTRGLLVRPAALNVLEGSSAGYELALTSRPTGTVTVTIEKGAGAGELTVAPERLTFTPESWKQAKEVTVSAAHDTDATADEPATLTHQTSGGGYDQTAVPGITVTIVENDASTLAVAAAAAGEQAGVMAFPVTISVASDSEVTVQYATGVAGDTAQGGEDYTPARGTLTFAPHRTAAHTIAVTITDDSVDEPVEEFTVTLSNAVNALLAGGGATMTAAGSIADDDPPPAASITDASLTESTGGGAMQFPVRLDRASGRTVSVGYASADGTATGGADYTAVNGTLTFAAGVTEAAISVPVTDDTDDEDQETFTITLQDAVNATVDPAANQATGTISDPVPNQLQTLAVAGAESDMYPAFDPGIHHYALFCASTDTLAVTATALSSTASLTLLRANSSNNQVIGAGSVQIDVDHDDDIAIELSDNSETATYVVHCLPTDFPDITVLKNIEGASGGLLLITPELYRTQKGASNRYQAIVDYNGVPRYHKKGGGKNFRRYTNGMTINGKRVWYSHTNATLLDENLAQIRKVSTPAGNQHDFLITDDGTFLYVVYKPYVDDPDDDSDDRDFSVFTDVTSTERLKDSVIREVTVGGTTVFEWNSWEHMKLDPDCKLRGSVGDYAHLNSLYMVDDDVVASFKGCNQVLRIDRSSGTGAIEWQLGGTAPDGDSEITYLAVKDEDGNDDEICSQHSAVVTQSGSVLLFDNGDGCVGTRKEVTQYTRVVEFDISSGTEARIIRKVEPAPGQGFADIAGSVRELDNGNWLISWGRTDGHTVDVDKLVSISEVQPDGTSVFEMNMSKSPHFVQSYRAYRVAETDVQIPLNLP